FLLFVFFVSNCHVKKCLLLSFKKNYIINKKTSQASKIKF
ncbi:MAG: hypothetical protein ACI976_001765, partial [Aureispira sp.]